MVVCHSTRIETFWIRLLKAAMCCGLDRAVRLNNHAQSLPEQVIRVSLTTDREEMRKGGSEGGEGPKIEEGAYFYMTRWREVNGNNEQKNDLKEQWQ